LLARHLIGLRGDRAFGRCRTGCSRGTDCGVMFATECGRLLAGHCGFSLIGNDTVVDGEIGSEMMMSRHHHDPSYVAMFPVDHVVMTFLRQCRRIADVLGNQTLAEA
jgi:hypothetical protein